MRGSDLDTFWGKLSFVLSNLVDMIVDLIDGEKWSPDKPVPVIPASFGAFREDAQLIIAQLARAEPDLPHATLEKMLCQMALETGYGKSPLATTADNFAGMEWRSYHGTLSPGCTKVTVVTSDGKRDYCHFDSLEAFSKHYILRLDRGPYEGWREQAAKGDVSFLKAWAGNPNYLEIIETMHWTHFGGSC